MQGALHAHGHKLVHVDVWPVKSHARHATAQVGGPPLGTRPQVKEPEIAVAVASQKLPVCPLVHIPKRNGETLLECNGSLLLGS